MDAFSYLVTFISLIPALALTRVLGGLADLVQHHVRPRSGRVRWSGLFVLWSLALVLYNAYEWWLIYGWRKTSPFSFWLFAFLLVKPSLLLFVARLFMPDVEPGDDIDLDAHYFGVIRWIVPLISLYILLDIPDTLLHGSDHFARLGGMRYALLVIAMSLLFIVPLLFTRRRSVHWLLFGLGFIVSIILQVTFNTSVIR
ncbi:MAG TPA: hypothetical protein VF656_10885 [Pyrinomonadaceae bacterium]|jgi:hypothetical protein